jgi:uncharacterized protein (DUF433 family)
MPCRRKNSTKRAKSLKNGVRSNTIMANSKVYVRTDEHGVMRVGETRVMLDGVVAAYWQGDSPESIRQQYPALTSEDVYGAIAYYLANRDEVDAYLDRQDKLFENLKRQSGQETSPLAQKLRALRSASPKEER